MTNLQRHFVVRDESSNTLRWVGPRLFLACLLCVVQLLRIGFHPGRPFLSKTSYLEIEMATLALLTGVYALLLFRRADRWDWFKRRWREPLVLFVIIAAWAFDRHQLFIATTVFLVVLLFTRVYVILTDRLTRPGLLFISSFMILILSGMLLLKLPAAAPRDQPLSWIDALFTSTSAVCVTGLIVRDTATQFTHFGQVIVLILIQLGGLGIVLFGALFAVMFGGSISLKQANSIGEVVESSESGFGNVDRLVRFVVIATLATEALGAAIIYYLAPSALPQGAEAGRSIFDSIFLSISAFCNAGFAPFTQSLTDYGSRITVYVMVPVLVAIGGLGFPVLFNVSEVGIARLKLKLKLATPKQINDRHIVRLNLHTKIVLITSLLLYVGGTLGLFLGQASVNWIQNPTAPISETVLNINEPDDGNNISINNPVNADAESPQIQTTARTGIGYQLADASFMSVSARTAGFNSLPMNKLSSASRYVLIILMFIGGSPGSTAGGIKTIVLAVLVLSIWSTIRGRRETEVFGRSIPFELVRRAGVAASLGFLTIAGTTLALTLVEPPGLENDLFEAVSACGTVGLSVGITAGLTTAGKIVLVMGMFLGRVGPLALIGVVAFGATKASRHARYRYPQEPIVMG